MKVTYKVSDKLVFELESNKQNDIFEQLAALQEVFNIEKCGKCNNTDLKFIVREDKDQNKYYEIHCKKCHAKLAFGSHKKGDTLFPKRKDNNGEWLPDGGWLKWNKEQGKMV